MATVQELVPRFKEAIANVLQTMPSENGDVRLALAQLVALWNNPEHHFEATERPPDPEKPPVEPEAA